jgi:hypothetical protein
MGFAGCSMVSWGASGIPEEVPQKPNEAWCSRDQASKQGHYLSEERAPHQLAKK